MDQPVLHAFVREVAEHERLGELAEALPTRARVSEASLPVVLAALHEQLERPLVCLLPEDADARDAAEAAAWFLGEDVVGYLPSRGVRWESGPRAAAAPRRRAGAGARRARARRARLRVRARGRRAAAARGGAARADRARAPGSEIGVDGLSEDARARRLRARRARRRPRPVRGARRPDRRLPDDRPRAVPHRVLRRRGRVDPRVLAVHAARAASGRRRARSSRPPSAASTSSRSGTATRASSGPCRPISSRRSSARPTSSSSPTTCAASGPRTA